MKKQDKEFSTREARAHLSELIGSAIYTKERSVVTRNGKAVVAIIPIEDYQLLRSFEDKKDRAISQKAIQQFKKDGQSKSIDALIKELNFERKISGRGSSQGRKKSKKNSSQGSVKNTSKNKVTRK